VLWMCLTSAAVCVIGAWCAELDPLSPHLYKWILPGALASAAGILMLAFGDFGSGLLVLLMVGALSREVRRRASAGPRHQAEQCLSPLHYECTRSCPLWWCSSPIARKPVRAPSTAL
jgi:hypothetical protein